MLCLFIAEPVIYPILDPDNCQQGNEIFANLGFTTDVSSFPSTDWGSYQTGSSFTFQYAGDLNPTQVTLNLEVEARNVPESWLTWSCGYDGEVYYTQGPASIDITLPAGTTAIGMRVETASFGTFTIIATASDGSTTTFSSQAVEGNSGAKFMGFYTYGWEIVSMQIISTGGSFSIGQAYISRDVVAPVIPPP